MAKNLYPRVEINTIAKRHSSVRPAAEDTTSILAMCVAEKGPTKGLTAVHSLAEFVEIFGELSYESNHQNALNIYNWLSNGGTAYVKRFTSNLYTDAPKYAVANAESAVFEAKYAGEFYTKLEIEVEIDTTSAEKRYTIEVIYSEGGKNKMTLEKFYRIPESRLVDSLSSSEYIKLAEGDAVISSGTYSLFEETSEEPSEQPEELDYNLETKIVNYLNGTGSTSDVADVNKDLENKLLAPFELILGAGYAVATDEAIKSKMALIRPDVILILDDYHLGSKLDIPTPKNYFSESKLSLQGDHTSIFGQFFKVYDNTFTDGNIYVTTTYFLSSLIPYNDNLYGIQNPVAGLRRGILSGALEIHDNLTVTDKNQYFKNRVNYVEKTTREYAIMGNRTYDGSSEDSYTALSFLNNVRVLERMKKEIERTAREYLFEFNDAYTLSQLSSILNKYVTEWILNRTLNFANVTVEKDPYSDEQINVGLNIRFNGTVEVIHVDIVIE